MNVTAIKVPETQDPYRLFVASYKPKIRPEGQLKRMTQAFNIDAEFLARFDIFRTILKKSKIDWGQAIIDQLYENKAFSNELDEAGYRTILGLYATHTRLFRVGRFDDKYLDSIEDIALFFLHHEVKSIWIAGAYRDLTNAHIDLVMAETAKAKNIPIGHSIKALTLALAVELNQIQRVYTMYEQDVSQSLIKDLSYGGMLTAMPKGRQRTTTTKGQET